MADQKKNKGGAIKGSLLDPRRGHGLGLGRRFGLGPWGFQAPDLLSRILESDDLFSDLIDIRLPRLIKEEDIKIGEKIPDLDVSETENEIIIKADIPGVSLENVKLSIEDNCLCLRGEQALEEKKKEEKFHQVERFRGSFSIREQLPDNIDQSSIEAKLKDGVLTVKIGKKEKEEEKKAVEIKVK